LKTIQSNENARLAKREIRFVSAAVAQRPLYLAIVLLASCLFCDLASAQIITESDIPHPLLNEDPFDVIILDEKMNKSAMIKIEPIENPGNPIPKTGILQFEFKREAENILEVPWANIAVYKSFNTLLLEEAEGHLSKNEFALAFRNLLYIYDHGGRSNRTVEQDLRRCMFEDAKNNFKSGEYEMALSVFEDLYVKDPNFRPPGVNNSLIELVLACYSGVLNRFFEQGNFDTVETTLVKIEEKFGKDAEPLLAEWEKKFALQGEELFKNAAKLAASGQGREAHLAIRRAERILVGRQDVARLQESIMAKFPLIVVGVSQPPGDANPNKMNHWGSRRVGRLTQRTIVELTGLSDEGGVYRFLNGTLTRTDNLGLKYEFKLEETEQFGVPPMTAHELSNRLLSYGDENSPNYDVSWAKVIDRVAIKDGTIVELELRTPFIRPEALIRFAYHDRDPEEQPVQNGKYLMTSKNDMFATYELNPMYKPVEGRQHPVIIEQYFESSSQAVDALLRGDIDIVDRISTADLQRIKEQRQVEARPYGVPTVHMLVPKIRGELAGDSMFRTGLSVAINRKLIINDIISGKREIDGCVELSGPFPIGSDANDQISYGYDLKVKPLVYSSKLGMVRVEIALLPKTKKSQTELPPDSETDGDGEKVEEEGAPKPLPRPQLVLAHTSSSTAREASLVIAQQWSEIGVETSLRQLDPGISFPEDDNWDILYVEAVVQEPLVDAQRLLGAGGLAELVDATINQSLQDLAYAQTWQDACRKLRTIHRQVSNDLPVIPLYQVKEYFAFRDNVFEVGRDIIHLYENVDRWRIQSFVTEQEVAKEQP
jgi:hypothetical protein